MSYQSKRSENLNEDNYKKDYPVTNFEFSDTFDKFNRRNNKKMNGDMNHINSIKVFQPPHSLPLNEFITQANSTPIHYLKNSKTDFKAKEMRYISIQIDNKLLEKSIVKISGQPNEPYITKEDFRNLVFLLKLVNLNQKVNENNLQLPNLLIEMFLRVLMKKKFIITNYLNEVWSSDFVNEVLKTKIVKKKEESLKYVIRETFTILTEKYRSIHFYYWHAINPESSLKIEREQNIYIGFTKFYFEEIMNHNKKMGKKDQINNYTLPNKKNGNLRSNNRSITPQFLNRLFKSKKFFKDFMQVLDSPLHSKIKKSLRAVLYNDAENKFENWINLYDENISYENLSDLLRKKVSGSKAKLPWFRVEIESAIEIVKNHIYKIKS